MAIYKIAGIVVQMDIKYERLKKQAEPYLYKGNRNVDISLSVDKEIFLKAKKEFPFLEDGDVEYMLYGALFHDKLLDFDGIMIHASAVAVGECAYLFSANSGVGKSTHTSYWMRLFKTAVMVNDDKPALRFINGNIYVYGTPFSGKYDISCNRQFILGGICFLERGTVDEIREIQSNEALPLLLPQTSSHWGKERIEKRLDAIEKILLKAKLYKMKCTNNIKAAAVSSNMMRNAVNVGLEELLPIINETLESGGRTTFVTRGRSMSPLLADGKDSVVLATAEKIKKGDVILYKGNDGKFVLHRIEKIDGDTVITRGDSLKRMDEPFNKENIIGKAVAFIRDGRELSVDSMYYKCYKFIYTTSFGRFLRFIKRKIVG